MTPAQLLVLLAENAPVIEAIVKAVEGGASKDALVKAIEQVMTEASDAEMHREFPNE